MSPSLSSRRRAPRWVRDSPSATLHAIAWRFLNLQTSQDLTERQEWLWNVLVDELEFRAATARPAWQACRCALCRPPF